MKTFRKPFLEELAKIMREAVKDDPSIKDPDLLVQGGLKAIIAYAKDEAAAYQAVQGWCFGASVAAAKREGRAIPQNPMLN